MDTTLRIGNASFDLSTDNGDLRSLGTICVNGTPLRNPANRFLPWFDSYMGEPFTRFRLDNIDTTDSGGAVIRTTAFSNPDVMFLEKRDCSGDPILRQNTWDSEPTQASFNIHLEPTEASIDGHDFSGFRYWFSFESPAMPLHRLLDRQTWELGGHLDGVNVVCRNLFDLPRKRLGIDQEFSTVGLDNWAGLLPGNLWARWSLLPAFDLQYADAGVLVAWFDEVSCIRSVVETRTGEDWLRILDFHYFEESATGQTNPKTILFCPDKLDDTDALNLWTRVKDAEQEKACAQFGINAEEPPAITFHENHWKNFHFDSSYEDVVDIAAQFHADKVFIDPVWQNGEAVRKHLTTALGEDAIKEGTLGKLYYENMCCSYDFEVAEEFGGESALKALCDRARTKDIDILSWMALHYSPKSAYFEANEYGHGAAGVYAAKESGRHPDTGYTANCWTVNLNAPIYEKIRTQLIGLCERTGLKGYLWDSFSNLGWWQVDYSDGTMRPQFDKLCELYADLANRGLYLMPEALVTFSSHGCCGLHGGNVYAGDLLGYSYKTAIDLRYRDPEIDPNEAWLDHTNRILRGEAPLDELFGCIAHKRVPVFGFHRIPRETWNDASMEAIRELLLAYKTLRGKMQVRTVLKENAGVLWEDGTDTALLFSFKEQPWPGAVHALTGDAAGECLHANTIYRVPSPA